MSRSIITPHQSFNSMALAQVLVFVYTHGHGRYACVWPAVGLACSRVWNAHIYRGFLCLRLSSWRSRAVFMLRCYELHVLLLKSAMRPIWLRCVEDDGV